MITLIINIITIATSTMHDGELYDDWQFFDGVDESEPLSKDLLTPPGTRRESFAPVTDASGSRRVSFAPAVDATELNDRRSSMVSNGELADYYRYDDDDDPDDDIGDLGDEHQEGVSSQLPGKLQQSTPLAGRCQVKRSSKC